MYNGYTKSFIVFHQCQFGGLVYVHLNLDYIYSREKGMPSFIKNAICNRF